MSKTRLKKFSDPVRSRGREETSLDCAKFLIAFEDGLRGVISRRLGGSIIVPIPVQKGESVDLRPNPIL